ncbi:MAG TPA: hypothetical protein V6D48_01315 [Oculatellaceae cyanobacterium]
MQKLSETVYSSLFWLISGLMVWLLIVPVALIGFPVVILTKAVGQLLFKTPQINLVEDERKPGTSSEGKPANAVDSLMALLLLTTLVEVPAFLASIISLQPTRAIEAEQVDAQMLQPKPPKARENSSIDTTDAIEMAAEEKIRRN